MEFLCLWLAMWRPMKVGEKSKPTFAKYDECQCHPQPKLVTFLMQEIWDKPSLPFVFSLSPEKKTIPRKFEINKIVVDKHSLSLSKILFFIL